MLRIVSCWGKSPAEQGSATSPHPCSRAVVLEASSMKQSHVQTRLSCRYYPSVAGGCHINPALSHMTPSSSTKNSDFRSCKFYSTMALSYERQLSMAWNNRYWLAKHGVRVILVSTLASCIHLSWKPSFLRNCHFVSINTAGALVLWPDGRRVKSEYSWGDANRWSLTWQAPDRVKAKVFISKEVIRLDSRSTEIEPKWIDLLTGLPLW